MPSQLLTLQDAHEKNFSARVTTDNVGNVLDIEIALTPRQRHDFIAQFELAHANWQVLSYGLLLRNAIAKYHNLIRELHHADPNAEEIKVFTTLLWQCVGDFAPLEVMINRHPQGLDGNNLHSIDAATFLQPRVENSCRDLTARIANYQKTITKNTPKITKLLTELERLKEDFLAKFINTLLTDFQVGKLFNMQNNSDSIVALGDYVASQLLALVTFSVDHAYALTGGKHSSQLLSLNRLTKILSDAEAEIEEKSRSLHAVRVANNRTPIPMTQIALSENLSEQAHELLVEKWLSITPYVSGFDRIEDVDKIVCFLLGMDYHANLSTAGLGKKAVLMLASAVEGAVALVFRTLWFLGASPVAVNADYAKKVDQWISDTHHKYSPVRLAKQWVEHAYQRSQFSIGHEQLIDLLRDKPTSYYEQQFSILLTAQNIRSFVKTLGAGIYRYGHDLYYMGLLAFSNVRDEALKAVIAEVNEQYQLLKDNIKGNVALADGQERKDAEQQDLLLPEAGISARWATYQPWQANEYVGLLDFLDTIGVGLADLINAMFRKAPGPATLWFIVANLSLVSVQWPSIFEKVHLTNASEPLADFTNVISTSFTGAEVAEGLTKKLVAVFLEWKLAFFASEGLLEAYHKLSGSGGFEFIAEVFGNPEKLTLGLMILITSGWSLAFIPPIETVASIAGQPITNYYAAIINFFSNEARSCREGIGGLNFIEYSFLGLKSWLFLAALLTGDPRVQLQSLVIKDFCAELKALNVLSLDPFDAENAISDLLLKFGVYNEAVIAKIMVEIRFMRTPEGQLMAQRSHELLFVERSLPHLVAFDELTSLLQTVQKMAVIGHQFKSQTHANHFYDLLVKRYDDYNHRVSAYGLLNNRMDGRNLLASFYNRYCHQSDLTLVKMVTLLPSFLGLFYLQPVPYALRGVMFLVTKNSPYMQHKIKKAFAEDIAMVLQAIALFSRLVYSAARAVSYSLRALVGLLAYLPALIAVGVSMVQAGSKTVTMDDFFDFLARIALHKISLTGSLRPLYSAVTTLAGTTHEDLAHQCALQLQSVNPRARDRSAPNIAPLASEGSISRLVVLDAEASVAEPTPIVIVVEDADVPSPSPDPAEQGVLPVAIAVEPEEHDDSMRVALGELYVEDHTACGTWSDGRVKILELLSTLTQRRLPANQVATLVAHLDPAAPYKLTANGGVRRVSACEQLMAYAGSFFKSTAPAGDFFKSSTPGVHPDLQESLLDSPAGQDPNPDTHLRITQAQ